MGHDRSSARLIRTQHSLRTYPLHSNEEFRACRDPVVSYSASSIMQWPQKRYTPRTCIKYACMDLHLPEVSALGSHRVLEPAHAFSRISISRSFVCASLWENTSVEAPTAPILIGSASNRRGIVSALPKWILPMGQKSRGTIPFARYSSARARL